MKKIIITKTNKLVFVLMIVFISLSFYSCKKEKKDTEASPSENLAIDSITATKINIITWEEILITAYTRGNNISLKWSANHGSMLGTDSSTVKYWACPSCTGTNTIECKASNEYGTISKTITINVTPE
jgi:hypothetical protein